MTRTLYVTKIHEKCYQDIKEWKIWFKYKECD